MAQAKCDLEREVTDKIIAAIEAGAQPWRKPWTGQGGGAAFPLRACGAPYRGINVLMLWLEGSKKGHSSSYWMTYRQASELGGQVRKGERSATVVKYGTLEKEQADGEVVRRPYLRAYRVFNADQIDGLAATYHGACKMEIDCVARPDTVLKAYFSRLGATVETSDDPSAYYHPARDVIHMPPIATFHDARSYYETLGHEAVHWTGGGRRLDRIKKFANRTAYAFEELVAEIGQCILFATIGLAPSIDQSAAYLEGWLQALADDKRMIFRAASAAQAAVDFITERCGATLAVSETAAA